MESFAEETTCVENGTMSIQDPKHRNILDIDTLKEAYPSDFTFPMAVIYDYVNFRNNWQGVLPMSWKHALDFVPKMYFQTNDDNSGQQLAVVVEEEATDIGLREFKKLLALGPSVRAALGSGDGLIFRSKRGACGDHYLERLVKAETIVYSSLRSFKEWLLQVLPVRKETNAMRGKVFVSQSIRPYPDGLEMLETLRIKSTLRSMAARVRERTEDGVTSYLVSVYSNVVCLTMLKDENTHMINIVNLLDPANDVANAMKLGLFLSGACREERKGRYDDATMVLPLLPKREATSDASSCALMSLTSKEDEVSSKHPARSEPSNHNKMYVMSQKACVHKKLSLHEQSHEKQRHRRRRKQTSRKPKGEETSGYN